MFTDTLANRPAFGFAGRLFISTDSGQIFEDTGSAWTLVADAGVGGGTLSSVCLNGNTTATGIVITAGGLSTNSLTNTSLTTGSILFADGGGLISQSNATFFWDNTNKRLGIGNASPGAPLDIHATGTNAQFNGTGSNNAYLQFQNAGVSKWRIGNTYNAGANSFDLYNNGLTTNAISINSTNNNSTFSGSLFVNNGWVALKENIGTASTSTYLTLNASSTGSSIESLLLGLSAGTTMSLNFPTSSNFGYTFPASTGTIALTSDIPSLANYVTLNTTQTITGIKTFNSGSSVTTFTNGISIDGNGTSAAGINLKSVSGGVTYAGGNYMCIYSNGVKKVQILDGGTTTTASLDLGSITGGITRTYTFPDANGTLALTSDLSSYLPLTGGTLTGQLYINPTNTGTIGLDVASDNIRFRSDNLEGNKRQLLITMGSGTLVQLTAQGYGANYGTDLAFYTATTGGVNSLPGIYITSGNNVGIQTGNPQTPLSILSNTAGNNISLIGNASHQSNISWFNSANTASYTYIIAQGHSTGYFQIYTGDTVRLNINSNGNVLIGSTTDNGSKLQITGETKSSSYTSKATTVGTSYVTIGTSSAPTTSGFATVNGYNTSSGNQGFWVLYWTQGSISIVASTDATATVPTFTLSSSNLQMKTTTGQLAVTVTILS